MTRLVIAASCGRYCQKIVRSCTIVERIPEGFPPEAEPVSSSRRDRLLIQSDENKHSRASTSGEGAICEGDRGTLVASYHVY